MRSTLLLRNTINAMLPMIISPPTNVCGGRLSLMVTAPIKTASSGVTSDIIIALVDSILLKSQ